MNVPRVQTDRFDGFVHADEGRLVDGAGRPLLLRGVGPGNWLLPEGYMWGFDGGPQSPREIEALVIDLVGPDRAARFWRGFQDSFITEVDIARIAAEGFDHVRLPINSRIVMDAGGALIACGMELIDRTIEWCRTHGLWVVLDLHGAPGGQTGTTIDDSPRGRPELFENQSYRLFTVVLWRTLAERYSAETVVAGYDLLNEPLPEPWQDLYADRLVALYREITDVIREVDTNHLIIYEGTSGSNNWSIFTEVWDPNSMLEFHKCSSAPDRPSIQGFLQAGARLGLQVYMGEGGENNLDWLQTAFQLFEDHGISWNFWPWKKIATPPVAGRVPMRRVHRWLPERADVTDLDVLECLHGWDRMAIAFGRRWRRASTRARHQSRRRSRNTHDHAGVLRASATGSTAPGSAGP